ncbi:protein phosphatase PP2A regulatory subunit B [Sphaeroforma arctica JP610]|uniref:Serine/threonine-protein phosphatase 2A 55 kDa regulatory subunit B n=1 Tax=Sphaeroforma arctica JP610 TaxID=667725 RepID=A0A0L0FL28_9EUKA|nr:protein phosphatase PP2A regulatory subunit B [Sphaeroforma arctica JP610]KNC77492.1 protein phosphatase PP2A regulatory subunit B [Sphaeroforma arctica JP610]|eukprot:XP_014151394.1 protein phosphatase PP2A regulatory subunit B [Sphaeroforma arctica JP610]
MVELNYSIFAVIYLHPKNVHAPAEYVFYTEFQSHEPEFDYLKSLEIEEKINKIKWLKQQNKDRLLLSTNDKTIKLWKIYEKVMHSISSMNTCDDDGNPLPAKIIKEANNLKIPLLAHEDTIFAAVPRRVYPNAHAYHINSISINSDDELFMSADDLRINLWHLSNNKESFRILDIKPSNMEDLTEVITAAEFHPRECNTFMYSSSKGTIKLCDMRDAAICDNQSKVFEEKEDPANKSFFSEIISSVSDIKFTNNGNQIVARDYLTVKVWDIRNERGPVKSFEVHEFLRSKMCDLYENDCIFDKFECTTSGNDMQIMTGSYHNMFHIFNADGSKEVCCVCA